MGGRCGKLERPWRHGRYGECGRPGKIRKLGKNRKSDKHREAHQSWYY